MSQASGLSSEAASKPLSSHRLESITPDSSTPQSGSPNSDTGYSPHSQPFAQRPTSLTSAGAAVRQSASSLPTPPPFTPGAESQPAAGVSPVAFADYSAGSCGSKGFMTDTPGVSSAWAGSSTKPAMQTESFAFHPPGASAACSPDVEQFNAAPSNVNPQHPPPDLLGQAVCNMAASADTDTRSEHSEAASHSSTTSRNSRRSIGQSPGDLLRKARVIFEKRVAVEGSSRIRHNRKNTFKTPMDKSVPPAVTPHNTPMDVATEQREDQSSPHKSHSAGGKASAPGTPGSVTGPNKASPAASPQSPEDRMVASTKALSPPDSNVSVVSIGSVCPTTGDVGRKLDFSSIVPEITVMPALLAEGVPDVADVLAESDGHLRGPMPLQKLIDSMQDTVTKQDCQELLGEFFDQPVLEFDIQRTSATSIDSPDFATEFMGPIRPPRRPRGWLSRAGTVLLWSLALLGICTAGLLAAEVLHGNMLSTPGVACTPENRVACLAARTAYFLEAGKDLDYPAALKMVKQLKWYVADLWDATFSKKPPEGVTSADIIREYASKYSDDKLQAMTVSQARQVFGPLGAEFMPPIIAAKLAAAGDAAAVQQPPEDLIAIGAAQAAVPAEKQQVGSGAKTEPPAVEQRISSDVTGVTEQLEAAVEAAAPEVAEVAAAVETATDTHEQPAAVDVAAGEASTVDAAAIESANTEAAVAEDAVTEVQEEVTAAEPVPLEEQPSAAADDSHHEELAEQPVVEATATPEQQQPEQLHQPLAFEEQQAPAAADFEQPEELVQQQGADDEPSTLAPAADSAITAPAFEEQPAAADEHPAAAEEPAAAPEEQDTVAEPSEADKQHHEVTKAPGFWSRLPYVVAALAAVLLPAAAYFASPLAQKLGQPDLDTAEGDGEVDGMDAYDHAAAQQAAAEAAEAAEAEAAGAPAVDEEFRDDDGGGLLSDEEYEPPIRTPHRRHSAAALLDAAISAGASTLEAVRTSQVLRLKTYKPTRDDVIAEYHARVEAATAAAAAAAAAAADLQEQLTPTAATRRTAAARTPRAAASGRTTSARSRSTAAAATHDDGEEVQQPAPSSTGGRPRRTTRGRKSVLPEVPEDQPAADEPLLSDDEPAAAAAPSGRAGRRRPSAPAMSADTEAEGTSGRRRRRSIGAAATDADGVTTPRAMRRSSRHSQG